MLRFVLLALFVAPEAALGFPKLDIGGRIVGGRNVTIEEFPWQISLRKRSPIDDSFKHNCGGAVLNERIVLTAAHCVYNNIAKDHVVVAGSSTRTGMDGVLVPVSKFVWHEHYNYSTVDNDIALILLSSPLPLNDYNIKPVKLAVKKPKVGDIVTITGWGTSKFFGPATEILNAVEVPIVAHKKCVESYKPSLITRAMICAGLAEGGKDSCQGDSGGPLVMNNVQYGIVSWGKGCGMAKYPGVYSSVAYLRSWINKNVKKLMLE